MVHPQPGATSTNSSSSLLSYVSHLHAQIYKVLLHIGHEIYMHLARSSFPELGYNTKTLHNLLQSLALML
jgi:regulator of sigma D